MDNPTPVEVVSTQSNALSIITYPNPAIANESFTISCGNVPANGIDLYIVKADGSLVRKLQKITSNTPIALPSGSYICVGVAKGMKVARKFVVR